MNEGGQIIEGMHRLQINTFDSNYELIKVECMQVMQEVWALKNFKEQRNIPNGKLNLPKW